MRVKHKSQVSRGKCLSNLHVLFKVLYNMLVFIIMQQKRQSLGLKLSNFRSTFWCLFVSASHFPDWKEQIRSGRNGFIPAEVKGAILALTHRWICQFCDAERQDKFLFPKACWFICNTWGNCAENAETEHESVLPEADILHYPSSIWNNLELYRTQNLCCSFTNPEETTQKWSLNINSSSKRCLNFFRGKKKKVNLSIFYDFFPLICFLFSMFWHARK